MWLLNGSLKYGSGLIKGPQVVFTVPNVLSNNGCIYNKLYSFSHKELCFIQLEPDWFEIEIGAAVDW